jgi:hypothetical protein
LHADDKRNRGEAKFDGMSHQRILPFGRLDSEPSALTDCQERGALMIAIVAILEPARLPGVAR